MTQSVDSFFGGAAGLSWPRANNGQYTDTALLNVIRGGLIIEEPTLQQMTDINTGAPQWWDQGQTRPKMQLVLTLLCDGTRTANGHPVRDERDRSNPLDTGVRRLYVRGKDMTDAGRAAFQQAGAPGPRIGGEFYVVWTGQRPSKMKNGDPARTWAAMYVPGQVTVPDPSGGGSPFGTTQVPTGYAPNAQGGVTYTSEPSGPVPTWDSGAAQYAGVVAAGQHPIQQAYATQQSPAPPAQAPAPAGNPFGGAPATQPPAPTPQPPAQGSFAGTPGPVANPFG